MSKLKDAKIMIVDDTPTNLILLQTILEAESAEVFAYPSGESALNEIEEVMPEIILLDINMPDMDGYQVCQKLKADKTYKDIPVIFISALTQTTNIIEGFDNGGVDYITKPFYVEEVKARVLTHLSLQRKQKEVDQLLNETLIGSTKALTELFAITCPDHYSGALKVRQSVRHIVSEMNMSDVWKYEVAAMFSNLEGNVSSAETVAKIVNCIPRLDSVGAILNAQTQPVPKDKSLENWPCEILGGQILKIVSSYETMIAKGMSGDASLAALKKDKEQFHPELTIRFENTLQISNTENGEYISVGDLTPGMILATDIQSTSGKKLLAAGTEISLNLMELLKNRLAKECIKELVCIDMAASKENTAD